jgi:hypothetical protein
VRSGQRRKAIEELKGIVAFLETDHARGLDRLDEFAGAYPSGGSSSPPADRRDHDDECPTARDPGAVCTCEGSAIDYSDRTGELAIRRDESREAITRFDSYLEDLVAKGRKAQRIVQAALIAGRTAVSTTWCESCARLKDHHDKPLKVPTWRNNLCQWCTRKQAETGAWPAEPVLRSRHDGNVVTPDLERRLLAQARDLTRADLTAMTREEIEALDPRAVSEAMLR